jgi:hypothetical protein
MALMLFVLFVLVSRTNCGCIRGAAAPCKFGRAPALAGALTWERAVESATPAIKSRTANTKCSFRCTLRIDSILTTPSLMGSWARAWRAQQEPAPISDSLVRANKTRQ